MQRKVSRYQENVEKCLGKASRAGSAELRELWHTMADSYRCLVEHDQRALTYRSWMRNNNASSNE